MMWHNLKKKRVVALRFFLRVSENTETSQTEQRETQNSSSLAFPATQTEKTRNNRSISKITCSPSAHAVKMEAKTESHLMNMYEAGLVKHGKVYNALREQ